MDVRAHLVPCPSLLGNVQNVGGVLIWVVGVTKAPPIMHRVRESGVHVIVRVDYIRAITKSTWLCVAILETGNTASLKSLSHVCNYSQHHAWICVEVGTRTTGEPGPGFDMASGSLDRPCVYA